MSERVHSLAQPVLATDARFEPLSALTTRISELDLTPLLILLVDAALPETLPHLAEHFGVLPESWALADNDTVRRRLIKEAPNQHRFAGTSWAILRGFDALGISGQLREWFEYGGEPYTFSVQIEVPASRFTEQLVRDARTLTLRLKNLRSSLVSFSVRLRHDNPFVFLGGEGGGFGERGMNNIGGYMSTLARATP